LKSAQGTRLATAAIIVMSSMVLSRVTGFVRETMLSWKVGLSWVQDAYIAAFTVPDLMYTLLVGGTISAALIPMLSSYLEKGQEEEGWKSASIFINTIFIGMAALCVLGILFAPWIIPLVAPGFSQKSPETKELAIRLMRILFPSVSFIMLAGICNGILNSYKRFAAAAYGPSIYNLGCALSILIFADVNPESMVRVAIGVACSAAVYFLFQLSFAFNNIKFYRLIIDWGNRGFQKLMRQAIPSLLSSSIVQVNVIIAIFFVSLSLVEGSVSAYRNANTVWQLPYGIFAMGIGTAMLPTLSRKFAAGELGEYRNILMKSLTSVLFLSMPSAVGFVILREPVVRAVFMWGGRFGEDKVPVVAEIMAVFSVAMITQSIVSTMNRAFYARQDTKTPLLVGLGTVVMNSGFGYLFYRTTDLGAVGMALSYSIISTVNSVLLLALLNKKMQGIHLDRFLRFVLRALPASLAMGAALWLMNLLPAHLSGKLLQLLYLTLEIGAGAAVYFVIMLLLKADEAIYFMNLVKDKINRKKL
jgi:putative peptidoglycan lipid II flippase